MNFNGISIVFPPQFPADFNYGTATRQKANKISYFFNETTHHSERDAQRNRAADTRSERARRMAEAQRKRREKQQGTPEHR